LNEALYFAQPVFDTALNANGIRNEAQKERKKKEKKRDKCNSGDTQPKNGNLHHYNMLSSEKSSLPSCGFPHH
jgi:hypothetical protein